MSDYKDMITSFSCPRWEELPKIPLYMDQVLIVLTEALGVLLEDDSAALTPTMINNYVKMRIIHAPAKKKYGRDHLALLIIITLLKKCLSMSEISGLISLITDEHGIENAYNTFCDELENALQAAFLNDGKQKVERVISSSSNILNAALMALTGKLLLQYYLREAGGDK